MEWKPVDRSVQDLAQAFDGGLLKTNSEYQRGEAWTHLQQAAFIDSIMRGYPVPAFILSRAELVVLGEKSTKFEIIDGQQRLLSLHAFCTKKTLRLPSLDQDSKFRIPKGVREQKVPWSGKGFDDLSKADQERLLNCKLLAIEVSNIQNGDELRDLFIRLQSGTPLTRQQVRDAWPGGMGPFIDSLAGRVHRQPSVKLFQIVDKRGQGSDDDLKDRFVGDRQTCAQLLRIFLARSNVSPSYVSVNAPDLDSLYHGNTDWDKESQAAQDFLTIMKDCERVFEIAAAGNKKKFRRIELFAVFILMQEIRRNERNRIDKNLYAAVAKSLRKADMPANGRATSAITIKQAVEALVNTNVLENVIERDSRRLFNPVQKRQIWERDGGTCQICNRPVVEEGDAEYDHIVRHELGGATEVSNGRLVHVDCHERGLRREAAI